MLATPDTAEFDGGPRTLRGALARTCAVTREVKPVAELIRFVIAPDGAVIADLKRKLPGRGLWLTASHAVIADAARRGAFSRGFRRQVTVSPALADEVEALLLRSAMEALAIAAKAGEVVAGFGKVESALRERRAVALIHAREASDDGIRKMTAVVRQSGYSGGEAGELPVIGVLPGAELDLALGRSNVIHAAVLAGAASKSFLLRSQILVRFRAGDDGHATGRTKRPGTQARDVRADDAVQTAATNDVAAKRE